MKYGMKRVLFILTSMAVLLGLVSCPDPLTEEDVVAAQDTLAPSIEILSPADGDLYYSEVAFSLQILDDAVVADDGLGDLASITFDISNDEFRGGTLYISTDGTMSMDDEDSDEIVYDAATGLVSFAFSTIDPNTVSGIVSVSIEAVDRNGNITEDSVTLSDNEGPYVSCSIVDLATGTERSYTEDTTVRLSGTLGNSSEDKDAADEIVGITWAVTGKSWNGELVIDKTATYTDSDTGTEVLYYNADEERYERENEGLTYPDLFMYYPETRTFTTDIDIPYGAGSVLPFSVTVTDKNEHETTLTITAYTDDSGPEITISYPSNENRAYFSANNGTTPDSITGVVGDVNDLASLKYILEDAEGKYEATDKLSNVVMSGSTFTITPDIEALKANGYTVDDGNIILTIVAVDDSGLESRPDLVLYEDSVGPVISSFQFVNSTDGENAAYAKDGSTLTFSCSATDAVSGSDVSISSATIGEAADVTPSGLIAVSSSWYDSANSDKDVYYSVTVVDKYGNPTTVTQTDTDAPQVMYYSGAPAVPTMNISTDYSSDLYARSGENINLTINSSRNLASPVVTFTDPVGSDYDVTADGSNTSFSLDTSLSEDSVASYNLAFSCDITDMAGNVLTINQGNVANGIVVYDSKIPDLTGITTSTFSISETASGSVSAVNDPYINGYIADDTVSVNFSYALPTLTSIDDHFKNYSFSLLNGTKEWVTGTDTAITPDTPYSLVYSDTTNTPEGSYSVDITVYDEAGNENTATIVDVFELDTIGPTVTVSSFTAPGAYDNYANDSDTVTLDFSISDNGSGVDNPDNPAVTILGVSASINPASSAPDFVYTLDLASESEDTIVDGSSIPYSVTIYDNAGNPSDGDFTDNTATWPAVTLYYSGDFTKSTASEIITNSSDIEKTTIDSDYWAKADEKLVLSGTFSHELMAGSTSVNSISATESSETISGTSYDVVLPLSDTYWTTEAEQKGSLIDYDLTVTDLAGNTLTLAESDVINDSYYDSYAPEPANLTYAYNTDVSGNGLTENGGVYYLNSYQPDTADTAVLTISNLDNDTGCDTNFYKIDYAFNSTTLGNTTSDGVIDLNTFYSETETYGVYYLNIEVSDKAGNSTLSSAVTSLTQDTYLPDVTFISFTAPDTAYPAYAKDGNSVTLEFTPTDTGTGVDYDQSNDGIGDEVVYIENETSEASGTFDDTDGLSGSFTKTLAATSDSDTIPYSVTVYDLAGNHDTFTNDGSHEIVYYYSGDFTTTTTGNSGTELISGKDENADEFYWATAGESLVISGEFTHKLLPVADYDATYDDAAVINSIGVETADKSTSNSDEYTYDAVYSLSDTYWTTEAEQEGSLIDYSLTVYDKAGNEISLTQDFFANECKYDSIAPDASVLTFSDYIGSGSGASLNAGNGIYYLNAGLTGDESLTISNLAATDEYDAVSNYSYYTYEFSNSGPSDLTTEQTSTSFSLSGLGSESDGTYVLTLHVYDKAGNSDSNTDFFSVTKDVESPAIAITSFVETAGVYSDYAKEDDTVELTFSTSDTSGDPNFGLDYADTTVEIMAGSDTLTPETETVADAYSDDYIYTLDLSSRSGYADYDSVNIAYTVTVYDNAGNSTSTVYQDAGNGKQIMFYYSDIFDVTVSLTSDKQDNTTATQYWLKSGDDVTLSMISNNHKIMTPTDVTIETLESAAVTPSVVLLNSEYEVVENLTDADDFSIDTVVQDQTGKDIGFTCTITDFAGNIFTGTAMTATTDGTNVTYDNVDPVPGNLTYSLSDTDGTNTNSGSFYLNSYQGTDAGIEVLNISNLNSGASYCDLNFQRIDYTFDFTNFAETSSTTGVVSDTTTDGAVDLLSLYSTASAADGTYTLNVTAYDQAGNSAALSSATSIYKDTSLPEIGITSFTAPGDYTAFANEDDTVTLKFTSSDTGSTGVNNAQSPYFTVMTIDSGDALTADDDGDGLLLTDSSTNYSYTYTYESSLIDSTSTTYDSENIPYSVTVYDNAGNYTTEDYPTQTDWPAVTYYNSAAFTVSSLYEYVRETSGGSYKATLDGDYWAKEGDYLALSMTATHELPSLSTVINTVVASVAETITNNDTDSDGLSDSTDYSVEISLNDDDYWAGSPQTGSSPLSYSLTVYDKAGNQLSAALTQADFTNDCYYDSTLPVAGNAGLALGGAGANGNYLNSELTGTAADTTFTVSSLDSIDANAYSYTFTFQDSGDGNVGISKTGTITTPAADTIVMEIGAFDDEADGFYHLDMIVTDKAGNTNTITDNIYELELDQALPSLTFTGFTAPGEYNNYAKSGDVVSLTFTANDGTGSGLDYVTNPISIEIEGDTPTGGSFTAGSGSYTQTLDATSDNAEIPYSVTIYDLAGNSDTFDNTDSTYEMVYYYSGDFTVSAAEGSATESISGKTVNGDDGYYWATSGEKLSLLATLTHEIIPLGFTLADASTYDISTYINSYATAASEVTESNPDSSSYSVELTLTDTYWAGSQTGVLVDYDLMVTDRAGNELTLTEASFEDVSYYDSTLPVAGNAGFALGGAGANGNYLNSELTGTAADTTFTVSSLDSIDANAYSYTFTFQDSTDTNVAGIIVSTGNITTPATDTIVMQIGAFDAQSDGTYHLDMIVTDKAGNQNTVTDSIYSLVLDQALPDVTFTGFTAPGDYSDYAKNGDSVTLTFTVDGTGSGVDVGAEVVYIENETTAATGSIAAGYTKTLASTSDSAAISYSVTAYDLAGNSKTFTNDGSHEIIYYYSGGLTVSSASESVFNTGGTVKTGSMTDEIDEVAGGGEALSPDTYWAASGETLKLTGTFTHDLYPLTGTPSYDVTTSINSVASTGDVEESVSGSTYSVKIPLSNTYWSSTPQTGVGITYTLTVKDKAGNTLLLDYDDFTYDSVYDSVAPVVSGLTFSDYIGNGAHYNDINSKYYLNADLSGTDDNESITINNLAATDDNYTYYTYEFNNSGPFDLTEQTAAAFDLSGFDGAYSNNTAYTLTLHVYDNSGNSTDNAAFSVTKDTTVPGAPVISTLTGSNTTYPSPAGYYNSSDSDVTITLDDYDDTADPTMNSGEISVDFTSGSTGVTSIYSTGNEYTVAPGWSSPADGSYAVAVSYIDEAGNESSSTDSNNITVDLTKPKLAYSNYLEYTAFVDNTDPTPDTAASLVFTFQDTDLLSGLILGTDYSIEDSSAVPVSSLDNATFGEDTYDTLTLTQNTATAIADDDYTLTFADSFTDVAGNPMNFSSKTFTISSGAVDDVAPQLSSISIDASGNKMSFVFDETLDSDAADPITLSKYNTTTGEYESVSVSSAFKNGTNTDDTIELTSSGYSAGTFQADFGDALTDERGNRFEYTSLTFSLDSSLVASYSASDFVEYSAGITLKPIVEEIETLSHDTASTTDESDTTETVVSYTKPVKHEYFPTERRTTKSTGRPGTAAPVQTTPAAAVVENIAEDAVEEAAEDVTVEETETETVPVESGDETRWAYLNANWADMEKPEQVVIVEEQVVQDYTSDYIRWAYLNANWTKVVKPEHVVHIEKPIVPDYSSDNVRWAYLTANWSNVEKPEQIVQVEETVVPDYTTDQVRWAYLTTNWINVEKPEQIVQVEEPVVPDYTSDKVRWAYMTANWSKVEKSEPYVYDYPEDLERWAYLTANWSKVEKSEQYIADQARWAYLSINWEEIPEPTPEETLSFMGEVEQNRTDYRNLLSLVQLDPMPRDQLMAMDALLDPQIPEAEVLSIYTSPVALAFETPVTLELEDTVVIENESTSLGLLAMQALIALLIAGLIFGFIRLLKRLQKEEEHVG